MGSKAHLFYSVMEYPVPVRKEFFGFQEDSWVRGNARPLVTWWSRLQPPTEHIQTYVSWIKKRQRIWTYIPLVESVFLANSITFNALRENSNIDLCIVVRSWKIWLARMRISLVLGLLRLKETRKHTSMRFSVKFVLDHAYMDLSWLLLQPSDPYLVYRIAHLVPIYHRHFGLQDEIYEKNPWIAYYLHQFPMTQSIFLWIDIVTWSSRWKRFWEMLSDTWIGEVSQGIVRFCIQIMLFFRCLWRPNLKQYVISHERLFKAYEDKRKRYALQWEIAKKNMATSADVSSR